MSLEMAYKQPFICIAVFSLCNGKKALKNCRTNQKPDDMWLFIDSTALYRQKNRYMISHPEVSFFTNQLYLAVPDSGPFSPEYGENELPRLNDLPENANINHR